jgi:four helix bundle protein
MSIHKDLDVWKSAINHAKNVYIITDGYPKNEIYGITSQMRRVSGSIGSNIAEGAARQSTREFIRFLYIALSSASELDTLVEISYITNLYEKSKLNALQNENERISRMIQGLIKNLKDKSNY